MADVARSHRGITARRRELFLSMLAESGQVRRAALAAGKRDPSLFYRLRAGDPQFAAQWAEAVSTATARIEADLLARAIVSAEAAAAMDRAGEESPEPLDFGQLMQVLKFYRAEPGERRRCGPKRSYASREETDAALMARLDKVEARVRARRKLEREARRAARAGAETGGKAGDGTK